MPYGADQYDAAANAAGCHMLAAASGAATQFAVYALASGAWAPAGIAGLAAGIGSYAYAKNCLPWDPNGQGQSGYVIGCQEVADGGWGNLEYSYDGSYWENYLYQGQVLNNTVRIDRAWLDANNAIRIQISRRSGSLEFQAFPPGVVGYFRINPDFPYTCGSTSDGTQGKNYTYTDTDTGCELNVSFLAWGSDVDNSVGPIFKIEPSAQARADGGVIGGCNFEPIIYYQPPGGGGGGKPPVYGPWNPDWDDDPDPAPWGNFISSLVGGVAALATDKLLDELFKTDYPASFREIYAACENKADGTPETFSVNFPEQPFNERVLTALDAIVDFQQQFFLWKTPICKDTPTPQTGDAVTINWISDERSLASGVQLKKLFTYFDHNNSSLEATVAHWRDFTWQAGPVIVSINGTQLGKPQVWAESEEEGKRVINHAAAIAGIDTSNAEWLVTSPRSSRYGLAGLMRVHRAPNGVLGITKRVGPSGLPMGLN